MISRTRGLLCAGMFGVVAIGGVSTLAFAAQPSAQRAEARAAAADVPPTAVEDFNYPGAAKVLQEQGITLKRGDGRITLTTCDPAATDQIDVWTRKSGEGKFCFRSTASTGHLTLEVPEVYAIATGARAVRAELSAEGLTQTVDVAKGELKAVGEGTSGAPTILLELRVTG
ncbi:hypothetical protein ACTMUQ_03890 [Streptomyces sp. SD11]|uniref:hypothetical protein n=1 Tax=Streptomyces sp. SD11 TaxID=3452209 RepID=UPI003F8B60FF